ncbi:MAG: glycogen debranching protein GlgX [Actinomycetota bacterium]
MISSIEPGRPEPPGAAVSADGVNFSVHAPHAHEVELSLFGDSGERRLILPAVEASRHHGFVAGIGAGQRYGFRIHGRWDPEDGIWSNPAKLLLDPYARQITGEMIAHPALAGSGPVYGDRPDGTDSAPYVPRSVVAFDGFDWEEDKVPSIPWADTVIYETHVRGLTKRHPAVPPEIRGTYAGLAAPVMIEHFQRLGVTSIELLPVQTSASEAWLQRRGLTNYWGYAPIGFFSPIEHYAAGPDPIVEFKQMVRTLHRHGIEVILDVVYNHTAEGNQHGATLCFRGLDNPGFYRLDPDNRRLYLDYTGTGNSVDLTDSWARHLVLDSLRYWVTEMHVDGFRFDLAVTLGRGPDRADRFRPDAPFMLEVGADPVLSKSKLIAEPWDLGEGGYQVGRFPEGWAEWNGQYRDSMRDLWRSKPESVATIRSRLTGSSDIFARAPHASINFVTCHDGFTLADLVSYDKKHNEANGENNRDGEPHNRSWNSGVEGPTDDPTVRELRRRRAGAMLATLFISQGVPMLLGGDESGRSQAGNNNAYCQDNQISWYDWENVDNERIKLVEALVQLRRQHPWLSGPAHAVIERWAWLLEDPGSSKEALYVMVNPGQEAVSVTLPDGNWEAVLTIGAFRPRDNTAQLEGFTVAIARRVS